MPELRTDPVSGRQVLIAEERSGRPQDFRIDPTTVARPDAADRCPFCEGREAQTPGSVVQWRLSDSDRSPAWQVRVIPNKYPAVAAPEGAHEIVVESPSHVVDVAELAVDELQLVFHAFRHRAAHWLEHPGIQYVAIMKNSQAAAGATLEHVHSQVLALPFVPAGVQVEMEAAHRFFQQRGHCLFCDLVARERQDGRRMVLETNLLTVFTAYAGRQPYETWILPRTHQACFSQASDSMLGDLAAVLLTLLHKLQACAGRLSYNLVLHTAGNPLQGDDAYHWHWELVPRLTRFAGLEVGSGAFVNTLAPERAAEALRAGNP